MLILFDVSVLFELFREFPHQGVDLFRLEAEAGRIGHEARADGADGLQHGQAVFLEGFPGLDDIDDHIGEAEDGSQFDGAV